MDSEDNKESGVTKILKKANTVTERTGVVCIGLGVGSFILLVVLGLLQEFLLRNNLYDSFIFIILNIHNGLVFNIIILLSVIFCPVGLFLCLKQKILQRANSIAKRIGYVCLLSGLLLLFCYLLIFITWTLFSLRYYFNVEIEFFGDIMITPSVLLVPIGVFLYSGVPERVFNWIKTGK